MKFDHVGKVLRLNAPDWYERKDFLYWLNDLSKPTATWHISGEEPGEYSDVFVTFDHGEGSDADSIPEGIWEEIKKVAAEHCFDEGLVWITNIPE